jgi:hypothetical protein
MKGNLSALLDSAPLRIRLASELHKSGTLSLLPPPLPLYRSPRVGLMPTKANRVGVLTYLFQPHRFFISPRLVHKGRCHMALEFYRAGKRPAEIIALTGMTLAAANKVFENIATGSKMSVDKFLGNALESDNDVAKCFGAFETYNQTKQQQQDITFTSSSSAATSTTPTEE